MTFDLRTMTRPPRQTSPSLLVYLFLQMSLCIFVPLTLLLNTDHDLAIKSCMDNIETAQV